MRGESSNRRSSERSGAESSGNQGPAVRLVSVLLSRAVDLGASDIHIEPREEALVIRFRVDGILQPAMTLDRQIRDSLVSRVKILANLDISERRLPQDGRLCIRVPQSNGSRVIDVRVSTLPTACGEKLVMRILDPAQIPLSLEELGLEPASLLKFQKALHSPHGLILVTGPTGSGKTSTLYSCLGHLNREEVNILTAEDPIEYSLPGINQLEVKEQIGLSFARALRSFLRQDPDIIMVGEIRDRPTAEISIRAAMTGHLVLSTLHTNDAVSAITRLKDLGVESFLIGSALRLVCAQRLVRRVCEFCRQPVQIPVEGLPGIPGAQEAPLFSASRGGGCRRCRGSGYRGRAGLFEVLDVTAVLRDTIQRDSGPSELESEARSEGILTLWESGLAKIRAGLTTVEEVRRATLDL